MGDAGTSKPLAPPPPVAGLLAALAQGAPDAAAGFLAREVVAGHGGAHVGAGQLAPVVVGRETVAAALAPVAASTRPEVLLHVSEGADCLLEAVLVDRASGTPTATVLASLQLDASGGVRRALVYGCPPVERPPSPPHEGAGHDARAALERYFAALDAGRLEEAAGCFSPDVLYCHPPYVPGAPWGVRRGRAALLAGFRERGVRRHTHEVVVCLQRGGACLLEAVAHGNASGRTGQFVSSLSLDADGLIHRYVACYSEPALPPLV